jgi:hypothetical protein
MAVSFTIPPVVDVALALLELLPEESLLVALLPELLELLEPLALAASLELLVPLVRLAAR